MPDLSTLTTLKDLEAAGWGLVLKCLNCGGEGEVAWSVVRAKLRSDLNFGIHRMDKNEIAWALKPKCSQCRVRGQATLRYIPPLALDPIDQDNVT